MTSDGEKAPHADALAAGLIGAVLDIELDIPADADTRQARDAMVAALDELRTRIAAYEHISIGATVGSPVVRDHPLRRYCFHLSRHRDSDPLRRRMHRALAWRADVEQDLERGPRADEPDDAP
jgi:hypothetical protein